MREMPDQVPHPLRRFDDRFGITWRAVNLFKRIDLAKLGRFAAAYVKNVRFEAPIFIVGMPRSGSTMLFHLLRDSPALRALPTEGHDIWRMYHHPRYAGWRSDAVRQGEVRWGERRYVNSAFAASFGVGRFVEKTADNCVRTEYLLDLFPDAYFVVIKRDPCDSLNSLINGWRHPQGRYRSYYVPEELDIPGYPHRHRWCFTLIEGWRDLRSATVPEIAFAQWACYVDTIVAARQTIAPSRWLEVHFEDVLGDPQSTVRDVCDRLGVPFDAVLESKLQELLKSPVNALSPRGKDKWRAQNAEEIAALLPRVVPLAERLGYRIDPVTGNCEILRQAAS